MARLVFVGGGKPGNFPLTGSHLPSHWLRKGCRGEWKGGGEGKGKGKGGETRPPALLPPTGFCLKYHLVMARPDTVDVQCVSLHKISSSVDIPL